MTKMYIANCTKQNQDFIYKLPEFKQPRVQPIPMGTQVKIDGDLNVHQVQAIIDQHAKYGMVNADEIDRTKTFIGVCYSLDKPVQVNRLAYAIEHNDDVLQERGKKLREAAAVSVSNDIQQSLGTSDKLNALDISIVEQRKDGGTPGVNDGMLVTQDERALARARELGTTGRQDNNPRNRGGKGGKGKGR